VCWYNSVRCEYCELQWELVKFFVVDGEDFARKIFRRAQNGIKFEGRQRKKIRYKISDINIFKVNFPQENINYIFLFPNKTLLIVCILRHILT
jgi:hypothetical protein